MGTKRSISECTSDCDKRVTGNFNGVFVQNARGPIHQLVSYLDNLSFANVLQTSRALHATRCLHCERLRRRPHTYTEYLALSERDRLHVRHLTNVPVLPQRFPPDLESISFDDSFNPSNLGVILLPEVPL